MSCPCLMLYPHKVHTVFPVTRGQVVCPWCCSLRVTLGVSCGQLLQGLVLLPCSFFCRLAFMSHAIMSGIGGCCLHARSSFSGGWPLPFCPKLFFMWPGVHSRPVSLFLLLDSCVVKQEGGAVGDEHLRDHFSCSSCSGGLGLFFMWPVATTGL